MRVAGLMSGSGSNLKKIIEYQENNPGYEVVVIFSDRFDSNACEIGKDFDIPVVTRDIKAFYEKINKPLRDLEARKVFDEQTVKALMPFEATAAAYAGYMSIATPVLIHAFDHSVNVHPADLSVKDENGNRKYTGDNAVRDAIFAGEKEIRSTTHIITPKVDGGPLLLISDPVYIDAESSKLRSDYGAINKAAPFYQDKLKETGDWKIFPKTLELMAKNILEKDVFGNRFYRGNPIPNGIKYCDLKD